MVFLFKKNIMCMIFSSVIIKYINIYYLFIIFLNTVIVNE